VNQGASRVDPSLTFAVSLIVSLVLWYSTLRGVLRGDVDVVDGGMRYLVALAISWAGVYFVSAIVTSYSAQHELGSDPAPPGDEHPRRRAEDPPDPAEVEAPAA
jgi:hypothetical protein